MNTKVLYISIKHVLLTCCNSVKIDEDSYKALNGYLSRVNITNKLLIVFDMKNVKFSSIAFIDEELPKKSALYFAFKDFIEAHLMVDVLFINTTEEIGLYLLDKDFKNSPSIFVLAFSPVRFFRNAENNAFCIREHLQKKWNYFSNLLFLDNEKELNSFISEQISLKIEEFIVTKNCISPISKEDHILKSTPVHVNKYVNLKPVLEDFKMFNEICFLLSELIISKFCIPDYIIAPSKNAVSIASGLLRYFKTTDLIIINQISPITSLNNYSNINNIYSKGRYAIIEDFHCMGTEIKVVKGILWSHGVNVEEDVYTFPIASTKTYDKDYNGGYMAHKIFPLYKLDKKFNYKMFTNNSCPACNDLQCDHRGLFKF